MKKIGTGRTAEVYDYQDNKALKLFYSAFCTKTIEDEYLIAKNISTAIKSGLQSLKPPHQNCKPKTI